MRGADRATLFKLHAWIGLAAGLYIGLMSVSGSALIFYPELYRALSPRPAIVWRATPLTRVQLKEAAQRVHPGYEVSWILERRQPAGLVEIWMTDGGRQTERLFNAFTGDDLGSAMPLSIRALNALKDFHQTLLAGNAGHIVNAAGAFLMIVLAVSGLWLLWPRMSRRRMFRAARTQPFAHWTLGLWTLPFVLLSGVTGMVLALESPLNPPKALVSVSYLLHGMASIWWPIRLFWMLMGLAVPILAVTGLTVFLLRARRSDRLYLAGPLSS